MHPQVQEHVRPLVIAHRGASGYRPEHTLAGYALAARMGADCIEPDLVATRDGVLVARHEPEISGTTDVAHREEFAALRTTKTIAGHPVTGWFVEDLTLAQLRRIRVVERLPEIRPANTATDGVWGIPTFSEILALRSALSQELGRSIVVYPELKHPGYLGSCALATEEMIVEELAAAGLLGRDRPVFIQCFETDTLHRLRHELGVESPLVRLMSAGQEWTAGDLAAWSQDADGIGPDKTSVIPRIRTGPPARAGADERLGRPTELVECAHAAGLFVHPYTFRAENAFLPADLRSSEEPAERGAVAVEISTHLAAGIDGFFTDHPDLGVSARDTAYPAGP